MVDGAKGRSWLGEAAQRLRARRGSHKPGNSDAERRRIEEKLFEERRQLLSIFEGINEVIYVTDPVSYEILYANRFLRDAFGKELVGGVCYREFQNLDAPCDFCTNDIILAKKGEPYCWEYYNPVLDRHYAITDRIIRWPDGRDVRFELAVDITKQKRVEEELRRYREHLEELVEERTARLEEKNAELEAFAYSVSHDLRAPLRAMQGFSRALLEDYASVLDARGRDYAERVVSAASRMDSLIRDLLDYSRISRHEIKMGAVSLDEVVEDALRQLDAGIREKEAMVKVEGPLPWVKAHYSTLLQVVANLISNAITFTAPGVKPEVCIDWEELDGWVRLRVADNGIGIAPEHRERIFRIFERLHGVETYPGTGIGLAVVRKGMERMGGRIGVESEEGKGSEFWIELPKGERDYG